MSVTRCLEGEYTCHGNARFVYIDKVVYCECEAPFYGNGIRCLTTGKRLILRGKVNGVLNNRAIKNVDLLAYVYTTNGRIETHIRSKQNIVRTMMKILQPIGDIIGWMFGVPQGKKDKNGFMITGGELNRTALIQYASGETVLITQEFFTFSSELKVHTFVQGTVPDRLNSISYNDFMEQITSHSRGVFKSCSTRRYSMNGLASYFTMDQTLIFNECQHNSFNHSFNSMTHVVTRNTVMNDRKNNVLRFSSTNQIGAVDGKLN
ncbi:nidogen (entactin) [Mytilus galloprovincialis]|uniref:Nidogen (Entactin) n=1 Tax=Mytilus galloprovincialis TaxID=29158 RepID=A0A8B6FR95_MYTGA|nr:nidogen (entactin) [Mytilus galloprovincialis]